MQKTIEELRELAKKFKALEQEQRRIERDARMQAETYYDAYMVADMRADQLQMALDKNNQKPEE
jgi:transposase